MARRRGTARDIRRIWPRCRDPEGAVLRRPTLHDAWGHEVSHGGGYQGTERGLEVGPGWRRLKLWYQKPYSGVFTRTTRATAKWLFTAGCASLRHRARFCSIWAQVLLPRASPSAFSRVKSHAWSAPTSIQR